MKLKGLEKFREKVPVLAGYKIILLPLYWFCVLLASLELMNIFARLPQKLVFSGTSHRLLSFYPLLGVILAACIGLLLVYQMWFWRDKLKAKYGPLSYQRIFVIGFAGISCMMSLSVNQFIQFWRYAPFFWQCSPFRFLVFPLESFAGVLGPVVFWARMLLGIFLLCTGSLMIIRSLQTFGFDYMAVIYLYFPEESKIQNHQIYSVLRHPAYASIIFIGLAGAFFTGTLYSFMTFGVILSAFYAHIHFVEEKELIRRFGQGYKDYMKKTPAFFVRPANWPVWFKFLAGKHA